MMLFQIFQIFRGFRKIVNPNNQFNFRTAIRNNVELYKNNENVIFIKSDRTFNMSDKADQQLRQTAKLHF